MSAASLVQTLHSLGAVVVVEDGDLLIDAIEELPASLLADLRTHKSDLLALLTAGGEAASSPRTRPNAGGVGVLPPTSLTRRLDQDDLAHCLSNEGLCLVLRDGLLLCTGPNGQGIGQPSTSLRDHVAHHGAAIVSLVSPVRA